MNSDLTCVWPARAILGESPCWHEKSGSLFWLDIKGQQLHRYFDAKGNLNSWPLPLRIGSIALPPKNWPLPGSRDDLVWICGTENGIAWLILSDGQIQLHPICNPEQHLPGNRLNDGKIGPDDRFYFGSMDDAEQQASGTLYALQSDQKIIKLDDGYRVTNGPAFSPDGRYVYHNDSARQIIYRFVPGQDGRLREKTIFRQFADKEGYPDGMTTDADGNLYVAMWDGWRIEIIGPSGKTKGKIEFPVSRVTSCTFAGNQQQYLFATTASIDTNPDEQPLAGGLFKVTL